MQAKGGLYCEGGRLRAGSGPHLGKVLLALAQRLSVGALLHRLLGNPHHLEGPKSIRKTTPTTTTTTKAWANLDYVLLRLLLLLLQLQLLLQLLLLLKNLRQQGAGLVRRRRTSAK